MKSTVSIVTKIIRKRMERMVGLYPKVMRGLLEVLELDHEREDID